MATAFPPALDTFVDPVGTDLLDNANALLKHDFQHTHINDAVAAIEAQVWLTGLLTGSGVPGAGLGSNTNMYLDTVTGIIYRKTAGTWAAIYTPAVGGGSVGTTTPTLSGGFSTFHRDDATSATGVVTGRMFLTGFIAGKSMTVNNLIWVCTTSSGTTTLFKLGIYSLDASQNGTLLMSTANTAASPSSTGVKTIAVASPTAVVAGAAYAFALLAVGGTPQFATGNTVTLQALADRAPFTAGLLTGQADLPASFTFAGLSAMGTVPGYMEVL